MVEGSTVIIRNPRVEFRKLADGGGAVLLNLETAAYHGLNETGSLIWETVEQGMTLEDLIPRVASSFEDAPAELVDEITAFVENLVERDLLRVDHPASAGKEEAVGPSVDRGGDE
jgi:hypothetical protein